MTFCGSALFLFFPVRISIEITNIMSGFISNFLISQVHMEFTCPLRSFKNTKMTNTSDLILDNVRKIKNQIVETKAK